MDWHVAEPGPRKRRPQTERDTRVKLHCSVALTALCGLATYGDCAVWPLAVCTLQRSAYAGSKPNRKKHLKLSTVARHRHAASRFERIHVRSYTLEDQISSLRVRRGAPCAGLPPKIATKGGLKRSSSARSQTFCSARSPPPCSEVEGDAARNGLRGVEAGDACG